MSSQIGRVSLSVLPEPILLTQYLQMFPSGLVASRVFANLNSVGAQLLGDKFDQICCRDLVGPQRPSGISQDAQLNRKSQTVVLPTPRVDDPNIPLTKKPVADHLPAREQMMTG